MKRSIDIVVGTGLLAALSPVMCLTALAVRLSSPGPVIFRQRRLTDGGRVFTIYKFRTMHQNAELKTGPVWASEKDPRVTDVGGFLRRTHLDEFPQLINVLKGEMSLIGPRPERPEMLDKLTEELPSFHRRMEVPAGITGLAQITSDYTSCMEGYRKKLAFDRLYVKNRSLSLDLQIAARTLLVLCMGGKLLK